MKSPKIYKTNYEEIQKKRLEKFYLMVHVVKIEIPIKKEKEIYNTEITLIYGFNLQGKKTIIGIYEEDKENARYWLEEIEKIKSRNLEKIKFISMEENKKLLRAIKIVYNDVEIIPSANTMISKIVSYAPNRYRDETGREILKIFLAENIEESLKVKKELEEKYSDNKLVLVLLEKYKKQIEEYYQYSREFRHLFCSYYTIRVMLYKFKNAINKKETYFSELEEIVNDGLEEYLAKFEANRSYRKKDWVQIQNEVYSKYEKEIEEYMI